METLVQTAWLHSPTCSIKHSHTIFVEELDLGTVTQATLLLLIPNCKHVHTFLQKTESSRCSHSIFTTMQHRPIHFFKTSKRAQNKLYLLRSIPCFRISTLDELSRHRPCQVQMLFGSLTLTNEPKTQEKVCQCDSTHAK